MNIASTVEEVASPTIWAEFGLAGLVIFALFAACLFLVKTFLKHIRETAENHKQERSEWNDANSKQLDKFEASITRLADSIQRR